MKKLLTNLILPLCFCFGFYQSATASHLAAADISYRCLGGSQYEITLKLYRDCYGINLGTTANVNLNSAGCSLNSNANLTLQSVNDVTPNCPLWPSSCSGGTYLGYEEWVYTGIATLPLCADWIISYSSCCRNAATQNMVNASSNSLYVEARLDNSTGICNSSPTFANPPIFMICDSMAYNVTHHTLETDGDSLVYSLATPLNNSTTPLTYASGYSTNQPLPSHGGISFNSTDGMMSFLPDGPHVGIFDVLVQEYRNGVLIGSSRRSIQLSIMNCGNNNQAFDLDNVSRNNNGVWASQGTSTSFDVCPGETLEFMLTLSDPDTLDMLEIDSLRSSIMSQYPNANIQLIYPNSPQQNVLQVWVTVPNIQLGGFTFGFRDQACPVRSVQSWAFHVNPRPTCAVIRGWSVLDNGPANCLVDAFEAPVPGAIVSATKAGVTLYGTTDANGYYEIIADTGTYTVTFNNYIAGFWSPCLNGIASNLPNYGMIDTVDFPMQANYSNCPVMITDISTPILRRCRLNTYTVFFGNVGSVDATNAFIDVTMDTSIFTIDTTTLPIFAQNGSTFTFQLGTVEIFETGWFQISAYMRCDTSLQGTTQCVTAHIHPDSTCYTSPSWDGVDIALRAQCLTDSMEFTIQNNGTAMSTAYNYQLFEDGIVVQTGTFLLGAGATQTIVVLSTGGTFRLQTDQSPFHPASLNPSVTVEGCAPSGSGTSNGWVNVFGEDDGALFLSIDCQVARGSWDPNEKLAFPIGYGPQHFIEDDQSLEYLIHFQNTGNDTAFYVAIIDTLSSTLDPNSIIMGASSHPYTWELMGTNNPVLAVRFDNIMLPDSNVNEAASHGFVKFRIEQKENTPIGTLIENFVDIYFDLNPPVRTNTVFHTIGENFVVVSSINKNEAIDGVEVLVYPNPFHNMANLVVKGKTYESLSLDLYDVTGRKLRQINVQGQNTVQIERGDLSPGVYFYQLHGDAMRIDSGKLIVR